MKKGKRTYALVRRIGQEFGLDASFQTGTSAMDDCTGIDGWINLCVIEKAPKTRVFHTYVEDEEHLRSVLSRLAKEWNSGHQPV